MNTIAVSTDFNGVEGLHTVSEVLAVSKQGNKALCYWAYARNIRDLVIKTMDGAIVTWVLRGSIK